MEGWEVGAGAVEGLAAKDVAAKGRRIVSAIRRGMRIIAIRCRNAV